MADRTIPLRELRNNISGMLRAAEAGESFTVTVRGRPVARLIPPGKLRRPRTDVDRSPLRRIPAGPRDGSPAADLDAAEPPVDDPPPAA